MPCLYVFVDIAFDTGHLVECIQHNFKPDQCAAARAVLCSRAAPVP